MRTHRGLDCVHANFARSALIENLLLGIGSLVVVGVVLYVLFGPDDDNPELV